MGNTGHMGRMHARSLPLVWALIHTLAFRGVDVRGRALTLANVRFNDSVLDLGCSTGEMTRAARRRGARVVGLDTSLEMLSTARLLTPGSWLSSRNVRYDVANVALARELPQTSHVTAAFLFHEMPASARIRLLVTVLATPSTLCVVDISPDTATRASPVTGDEPFLGGYRRFFQLELTALSLLLRRDVPRRIDVVPSVCSVWVV